jgi:hypothetical protein
VTDEPDLNGMQSDTEEVDAIHVPAGGGPLPVATAGERTLAPAVRVRQQALSALRSAPAVQAAAVAAGGLLAGAAVVGLARRRQAGAARERRVGRSGRARRRAAGQGAGELLQIVGSRSLLVDVHLLGAATRRG